MDFGARRIRVLIARHEEGSDIQILGHGVAPGRGCVSHGVIQDLSAAQAALKQAISAAEKEARVKIDSLFCGINGKSVETFIREGNVELEREVVEDSHMEEALDIASRDVLAPGKRIISSTTSREWYVDDLRVINPLGIRGHILTIRAHFARLPAAIEENIVSCVESQRCEVEDMVFLPLAAPLGCLTPEDMELGVAVLDMGRTTTGLAVFRDYRILGAYCFEWGGYHITRDVAAGLQVSFEEADELILEYGIAEELIGEDDTEAFRLRNGADPSRGEDANARIKLKTAVRGAPTVVDRSELDVIVFERAKELLTKVRQHLHSRGLIDNLVRGVIMTGGAATIKNYIELAEVVFEVPCRIGLPMTDEAMPHAVGDAEFSAAVGLVRHAIEHRAAGINGRFNKRGFVSSGIHRVGKVFKKYFL